MRCPICGEEHPNDVPICPNTGEQHKKMCLNQDCSYYRERIFGLDMDACPCCGRPLFTTPHEYVDLGLSVKWATCNIGASEPEEYGDYFAWGETEPKDDYDMNNYKFYKKQKDFLLKYNTIPHSKYRDNRSILEPEDDVASVKWGDSWRMPTIEEWDELIANCTWTWTSKNGIGGYQITSLITGNRNKSIFLPKMRYRPGSATYASYWSSSLNSGSPFGAYYMWFHSEYVTTFHAARYDGMLVRPVSE